MEKTQTTGNKILSVVLGAIITGFMWRCRGEGGFGSSWGLYSVGLVLMMIIFHFYSDRKGMKYEMIPLGGLLLGLSVTGYATVIDQLAGVLYSDLPYSGEMIKGQAPVLVLDDGGVCAPIDHISGAVIIFIMAFTLIPLFSFFVTSLFSDKEYKIKHYIIVTVIFFVSQTIFKATVSHFILKLINPDQVQYAMLGLKEMGLEFSSPMKAYMSHFLDRSWADDIPFFENYYMSVEHISDALAVITISLYALIGRKDKYTGFGSIIINLCVAVVSTVLTSLVSDVFDSGFFKGVDIPDWYMKISDWGVWEFLTGFAVGLFTMLFLAITANKYTVKCVADEAPLFTNKKLSFAFNFVLTVFIFGVTPARAISIRFAKLLEKKSILPDDEPFATILIVVLSIIFGIFMIMIMKKNILGKGTNPFNMKPVDFSIIALPAYLAMCFVVYFFFDDCVILHPSMNVTIPMMLIASGLIAVIYLPYRAKLKKSLKG